MSPDHPPVYQCQRSLLFARAALPGVFFGLFLTEIMVFLVIPLRRVFLCRGVA